MTLDRRLTQQELVHQSVVLRNLDGWEVREEEDAAVLRHVQHDDWHRVERVAETILVSVGFSSYVVPVLRNEVAVTPSHKDKSHVVYATR